VDKQVGHRVTEQEATAQEKGQAKKDYEKAALTIRGYLKEVTGNFS
jgi:hypothetical protein